MLFQQLFEGGMDGNLVQVERHCSLNARTENYRSAVCLKQAPQHVLDVLVLRSAADGKRFVPGNLRRCLRPRRRRSGNDAELEQDDESDGPPEEAKRFARAFAPRNIAMA